MEDKLSLFKRNFTTLTSFEKITVLASVKKRCLLVKELFSYAKIFFCHFRRTLSEYPNMRNHPVQYCQTLGSLAFFLGWHGISKKEEEEHSELIPILDSCFEKHLPWTEELQKNMSTLYRLLYDEIEHLESNMKLCKQLKNAGAEQEMLTLSHMICLAMSREDCLNKLCSL